MNNNFIHNKCANCCHLFALNTTKNLNIVSDNWITWLLMIINNNSKENSRLIEFDAGREHLLTKSTVLEMFTMLVVLPVRGN